MNLTNFNIKDFFISNNFLICQNSNILTPTKNILIYQIILLFIFILNKLSRIGLNSKKTPSC